MLWLIAVRGNGFEPLNSCENWSWVYRSIRKGWCLFSSRRGNSTAFGISWLWFAL